MPNRLDFDVVFAELGRLDQTGNIAVLSAVIIVLLLYLLVVIFARKADKRDKAKEGPAFHLPLTQGATYEYDLTVVTGVWRESGTDANVAVVIHGSEAESQPIILHKNMINSRTILARGNDDKFVIYLPVSLGIVQYIRVWHDNSGKSPSWYFGHAIVRDRQTGRKWTFISNSWLALEKGEGRIDKILTPISRREMKTFKHSLNSRGSKSFSEGHLWLSVVTKPPRNKFTRVQRATCCLCLLFSAMLANALFYRTDETADPTIQIGPLKFSWRQIVVGIESALIVTPVNLLITSLFKNSAKKPSKKVDITKLEDKPEPVRRNRYSSLSCEQDTSCEKVAWKNETSFWTRTRKRMCDKTKKDFFCPHFCIYISWFLSFATVSVSALFTFFFSLMWGKDIANQWLSSMLVSFTEDLFVLQPIKIVLIMVLVACFFSDRVDTDFSPVKNHKTTEQLSPLETEVAYDAKGIIVEMPEEAVLEQAREYRVKEEKMYSFGRELLMYLLFLLLLTTVCYGNRSYHGYLMTKNIKDIFSNYSLAKDPRFFWSWLNGQFVDGIYAGEWYNKDRVKEQEYIGNKMSILLGVPRLRQLRVQKDSCMIPEESKEVVRHCNDFYSLSEEDRTHLSLPGWRPFTGSVSWANLSDLCPAPWRYVTMEKIHNSPSWGFFHVYDGGGYIADLGYSKLTAEGIITNLREYGWLDRQTRAVLLEFSVYNPNTGYISISTYHYEILPTGYGNPFAKIDTLPLTSTQTGFYRFYLICQLLFILMVIFFMLKEFYNIFKKKCSYFRNAWNWVEILQIMFSFLVVVFYVLKSKMILKSVVKVKKNPFVSVSFGEAVDWSHAENSVLALTVFTTTVKLLRMIRFNPHVSIMMSSLRLSRGLLVSYSVILAIIILSYAQLGRLALGGYMLQYSSFQRTLFTEFVMCLGGKMDLEDLTRANRVLGPLFGFSFRGLMSFIFVNFFVAIFNDSYEEIKDNTHKQSKNFEMHDFILERLRELLGFKKETQRENDIDNNPATPKHTAPESVSHEKLTFTSVAVSSQRLCRMARRKQPRISKEENRNERATVVRFKCESTAKMADVEARKRRIQKLKCVTSSFFVMKSLTRERMFRRMSDLTDKLAMDEVEQDKELLSIIRFLLLMNSYYDDCYRMCSPDKTSSYDDNAITSLTTPSSSPISRIDMETSEPGETLELLRSRETSRPLPYHLRGMELREQLRSTLATKRAKRVKPKPSNSFIYKHYAFL